MKDRGGNIERQIMFSHAEEAIQVMSSDTSFISNSSCMPALSCLVDFTQAQSPDAKVIGTNLIFCQHVCLNWEGALTRSDFAMVRQP